MALSNTVQDLITAAYRSVGIIGENDTPSTAQLTDGLLRWNTMMMNWMGWGVSTWARSSVTFSLTAGTQSYSIGPGGDVDTSRPLRILEVYRSSGGIDTPLFPYSKQEYYWLSNKTQSGIPTQWYYDQESPRGNLFVWPVPDAASLPMTVTLDCEIPFQESTLGAVPDMPDHWQEAAIYNLAIRLAVKYGRPIDPNLNKLANDALELAKGQEYEEADIYVQPDFSYGKYGA